MVDSLLNSWLFGLLSLGFKGTQGHTHNALQMPIHKEKIQFTNPSLVIRLIAQISFSCSRFSHIPLTFCLHIPDFQLLGLSIIFDLSKQVCPKDKTTKPSIYCILSISRIHCNLNIRIALRTYNSPEKQYSQSRHCHDQYTWPVHLTEQDTTEPFPAKHHSIQLDESQPLA